MEYSYLQQPGFDSSCNLTGMPVSESTASQSFYRYSNLSHYNCDLTSHCSDLTSCGQMMSAANQYYRSSAAAAAQMRSVYNPAGKNQGILHHLSYHLTGMPGAGSHYSVMGRSQDPRSSMFGSSLNLNGENSSSLCSMRRTYHVVNVFHAK